MPSTVGDVSPNNVSPNNWLKLTDRPVTGLACASRSPRGARVSAAFGRWTDPENGRKFSTDPEEISQ
jgi:hypothetical protein